MATPTTTGVTTPAEGESSTTTAVAARIRQMVMEKNPDSREPLPSYRELAGFYGVSANTVQNAVAMLETERLVCRVKGRGTFLRSRAGQGDSPRSSSALKCINIVTSIGQGKERFFFLAHDEYLAGYTEALDHTDIKMRIVLPPHSNRHEQILSPRFPWNEQACVLVHMQSLEQMEWLVGQGIPFVLQTHSAYRKEGLPPHHAVFVNKVAGAAEATRHLLSLGHRRIGFLGRATSPVFKGFDAAMACAGLMVEERDASGLATDDFDAALPHVAAYLRRPECPTAVLAQTDAMALAVLEGARALGIRVPEELSVVGFNGLPEGATSAPPLTTVAEPMRFLARSAVEMLLEIVEGKWKAPQARALDCHVVVRASTAPPAAG